MNGDLQVEFYSLGLFRSGIWQYSKDYDGLIWKVIYFDQMYFMIFVDE